MNTLDELYQRGPRRAPLPEAEERQLILAAQHGDEAATWRLLEQYSPALGAAFSSARRATKRMTASQRQDLQADLALAAVATIKEFDLERFTSLRQVLAPRLRDVATRMATALSVPRGTLALWFKIWRAADQDYARAAELAPTMGMTANTFRAVQHALAHADSDWVARPYDPSKPAPDEETSRLAEHALQALSPAERQVVEYAFGFSGAPKSDDEVAEILGSSRATVRTQRQRAIAKMRAALA